MITFSLSLVCLLLGYFFYGSLVEKVFGADAERRTPCYERADSVDYVPMPTWKVFLIQFLNIAGTGPIYGAIMGILFGPAAYLWIVLGCIFAGATHDYLTGMICLRQGGISLPELIGDQLGMPVRQLMRVFSVVLLVLVGTVFVITPADLLANLTAGCGPLGSVTVWTVIIFVYYILATVLPIGALIGRIYPIFGLALLVMAVGVGYGVLSTEGWMPELTDSLSGHHPRGVAVFPMMCITIACGAISGFHATQSPLMARCLKNERYGRRVFYGSMITEGVVALIWAAAAIKFAGSYEALAEMGNPAVVVNTICHSWLGLFGAVLAILGVVAAPITTGDTAFRGARLIVADFLHLNQGNLWRRLALSLPLFLVAAIFMMVDFNILWRYFAWLNQTLGCISLWAVTVWMCRHGRTFWISLLPAMFMTVICISYILCSPEGFGLPRGLSISIAVVAMLVLSSLFLRWKRTLNSEESHQ